MWSDRSLDVKSQSEFTYKFKGPCSKIGFLTDYQEISYQFFSVIVFFTIPFSEFVI